MRKNKLSSWQFAFLICFPILSFYNGIGTYHLTKFVGNDSYLSVVISYLFGILLYFLFSFIFQYRGYENIMKKNEFLFGKKLGKVINGIMIFFAFLLGVILLYNISNFVISEFLNQTPIWIFMIVIGIIVVLNVSKGIVNIARVAVIFLILIFILSLFNIFGLVPHFKVDYLKPFLDSGIKSIFFNGIELAMINVTPIFLLLSVRKEQIQPDKNLNTRIFLLYSFAYFIIFLENILTIGSLSVYLMKLYQYPEHIVLQKISLFHFIDRVENFIYIKWILCSVISLSLIIYYITKMFPKVKLGISSSCIMVVMIICSLFIFKTNTYFYSFLSYVFPYIVFSLFIIYLGICINIFIRMIRIKKRKT